MGVGSDWEGESTGKTEISQLEDSVLVDEEVLGLEVTVDDTMGMAEGKAVEELVSVGLHLCWGQLGSVHVLLEVLVCVLEDEVELRVTMDDVLQLYDVGVFELTKKGNFSDGR